MTICHCGRRLLVAAFVAAGFGTAYADEVTVIQQAEPVDKEITVIQEPTSDAKVTVVKESDADLQIRHEAIYGIDDAETAIVVKEVPPEPRQEVVTVETRPAEDFVWVPGYWRWDGDRSTYEWVPGAWRRSVPGLTWHPGHWQKSGDSYVWVAGFWSTEKEPSAEVVVVKEAPPAPREETRPASPGADYAWIPGHWEYKAGQYTWVAGRWERPAGADMVWVPGQWVRQGEGYAYVAGHWDYPEESRTVVVTRED